MKPITKITLAAAIASSVSIHANAVAVSGTVTDLQFTVGLTDIMAVPQATFTGLTIGGDTVTGLTLSGEMVAYTAATWVKFNWNLTNGMRQGYNGAYGTIFEGGTLELSTSSDNINFTPFDTIDASLDPFEFLAGYDGALVPAPNQTTAGLVVDDNGYGTLPGIWDLQFFGYGWNNAASVMYIAGNSAGIFMEGSIAPVPVPAAAWLFGTALISLMGMGRRRQPK